MTTHEIRSSNHYQINDTHGRRGSRAALVADVKARLRFYGHRSPVASRWPDGSIGVYECLSAT